MGKTDKAKHKGKQRVYLRIPDNLSLYVGVGGGGEIVDVYAPGDPDVPDGWEPRSLDFAKEFVRRFVLNDPSWGKDMDRLYMAMDLRTSFNGRGAGDVVELSKEEHEAICEVVRRPGKGYSPALAVHFSPWFDAVLQANEQRPRTSASNGADESGLDARSDA